MKENSCVSNEIDAVTPKTFSDKVIDQAKELKTKRNILFVVSIILLNICTLVIAWGIEGNITGYESIDSVVSGFDWKYMYLILAFIFVNLLLKTFPDFLVLYSKNRQRRFLSMLNANIKWDYYNCATVYSRSGSLAYSSQLAKSGVKEKIATDISYGKIFINKISMLLYSFVVLTVGFCLAFDVSIIWIILTGILGFLINCIVVFYVLFFDKTKDKCIKQIAGFCKTLYRLKIVKNYEKLYADLVDKLIVYNTALKTKKGVLITQIISSLIIIFFKHCILYFILLALNYGSFELFIDVLFRVTILDLIIAILPLNKGTLFFELFFILLFGSVFFKGYVLWGMLIYRIFDYFMRIILYLIVKIFDVISVRVRTTHANYIDTLENEENLDW